MRKVEVFRNGEWTCIRMQEIKENELFRMFESDNDSLVVDENGESEFYSQSDAKVRSNGAYCVQAIGKKEHEEYIGSVLNCRMCDK